MKMVMHWVRTHSMMLVVLRSVGLTYLAYPIYFVNVHVIYVFFHAVDNCGRPPSIANGTVNFFRGIGRSTAFYLCRFGYTLEGRRSISCLHEDGMWEQPPTCKPVQ